MSSPVHDYFRPVSSKPRGAAILALIRWNAAALLALLVIAAAVHVPLLWNICSALKSPNSIHASPPTFFPPAADLEPQSPCKEAHAKAVLDKFNLLLFARNSLYIAALTVIGSTFSSALVAYGFAKIPFRGRKLLFAVMLGSMMIPFPVTMTTLFLIFRWMGEMSGVQFLGTFKPLWLPAFFGSAFNIFLLRQFFLSIPEELSEAARLDGCSELGIFLRIILPLAKPALAVVALFAFMTAWNDFLAPLVYLQDPDQYTLSLGLQNLQFQHGGEPNNVLMAAALLTLAPVLLLFLLVQKSFIEGIATTGLKG